MGLPASIKARDGFMLNAQPLGFDPVNIQHYEASPVAPEPSQTVGTDAQAE
jgi:hypothetical protein